MYLLIESPAYPKVLNGPKSTGSSEIENIIQGFFVGKKFLYISAVSQKLKVNG